MSLSTKVEKLTPAKAKHYLEKMAPNRPYRESYADYLGQMMAGGKWKLNGESLKFDTNGLLQDGQHRCWAVIKSGASIDTLVVRGIPPEAFDSIDTGWKRSLDQLLARAGESHYKTLAGAIMWLWRFKENKAASTGIACRHDQAFAYLAKHPGLRKSVDLAAPYRGSTVNVNLASAVHYLADCSTKDGRADRFLACLMTGENISRTSPETSGIYWLRQKLQEALKFRAKMPRNVVAAMTVKAWNGFAKKEIVKVLRWADDEKFPEFV